MLRTLILVLLACCLTAKFNSKKYTPDWASLDTRPDPAWYDKVKFGIFIHWGVFSVPSYSCDTAAEWYWFALKSGSKCTNQFHNSSYGPTATYADFAKDFTAEFFNPNDWADLFQKSGAKYVVLTSKHHEGFTNWPSAQSWNWNSVDVGPHKDLVGLLTDAVRAKGLHMGLYHSLFEWYNPLYLADAASGGKTSVYTDTILLPQMTDIINRYKPDILWTDGEWDQPDTFWKSQQFLAWLFNDSPVKDTVIINDRWGKDTRGKHGGVWTGLDRFDPKHLVEHKWENCFTIDKGTWGWARNHNIEDYFSAQDLIYTLIRNVAFGGNLLLNIGPNKEGMIPPIFQDRLLEIGKWLDVNGEGIYNTRPWARAQNQTIMPDKIDGYYTFVAPDTVYFTMCGWPSKNEVNLPQPVPLPGATVSLVGYNSPLQFNYTDNNLLIKLPSLTVNSLPSKYAWTLRLTHFK